MISRLKHWIAMRIALTAFSGRHDMLLFACYRAIWTRLAVVAPDFGVYQTFGRLGICDISMPLELVRFSSNRECAPSLCFYAIADGKPRHTFPGIALPGIALGRLIPPGLAVAIDWFMQTRSSPFSPIARIRMIKSQYRWHCRRTMMN